MPTGKKRLEIAMALLSFRFRFQPAPNTELSSKSVHAGERRLRDRLRDRRPDRPEGRDSARLAHVLLEATSDGHCALPLGKLKVAAVQQKRVEHARLRSRSRGRNVDR